MLRLHRVHLNGVLPSELGLITMLGSLMFFLLRRDHDSKASPHYMFPHRQYAQRISMCGVVNSYQVPCHPSWETARPLVSTLELCTPGGDREKVFS